MPNLLNYCNLQAIKLARCPGVAIRVSRFRRIFTLGSNYVHTSQRNGDYLFDARNNLAGATRRVYGVITGNNGCGIYVPIGRQNTGAGLISPVPICVGGGRDMRITAGGLANETDQEVIEREGHEEINQRINVTHMNLLNTGIPAGQAEYYSVRLGSELSTFYYSWHVANSDQVTAIRYWALPTLLEQPHGTNQVIAGLARLLYNDMSCPLGSRATWEAEWHGLAYQDAINQMLNNSVRVDTGNEGLYQISRWYGNKSFTYNNAYAAYPPNAAFPHEGACGGACAYPGSALATI